VYALLSMGISASILAFDKGGFTHSTFLAGSWHAYSSSPPLTDGSLLRRYGSRRLDVAAAVLIGVAILVFARGVRRHGAASMS